MEEKSRFLKNLEVIAGQKNKERNYWMDKFSGEFAKSCFPYDFQAANSKRDIKTVTFSLQGDLFSQLIKVSKSSDIRLFVILAAGLVVLMEKYTGSSDITVGAPIYKQGKKEDFINTVLPLRNRLRPGETFKEILFTAAETIQEANRHQNYPLEVLAMQLNLSWDREGFPWFDTAVLLENVHEKAYIRHIDVNLMISFLREENSIAGELAYNASLYRESTIRRIFKHLTRFLQNALLNPAVPADAVEILSEEEKKQLLIDFNDTRVEYPGNSTIHELFAAQVEKTPHYTAVVYKNEHLSYKKLLRESKRLAGELKKNGIQTGTIIGIMLEKSPQVIVAILGVLEAGGVYLPLTPGTPQNRIVSILIDCGTPILLTEGKSIDDYSYTAVQHLDKTGITPFLTGQRDQITDLDHLPIPDRSLVNYDKYNRYIGMAIAKNSISIQATRGCPYNCVYCHKIWPKKHLYRSAGHIFAEVELFYNMGVRRFAFIDDIFNLEIENSRKFFEMIIKSGMKLNIFFPNGLRGDRLTGEYIDIMMEAGVVNIALALETASPRLQKMIRKNLDIEKLHENMEYICTRYPHVLLELFTMHGFPTETEEEAMKTLDFIKSLKWIHIPHVNVLKIYPNSEMAELAIAHGVSREAIARSVDFAYHQLPETLPFSKNFTKSYQSDFLNNYFLSKKRLLHVIPHQKKILTKSEFVEKYDSFLPAMIDDFPDILRLAGISDHELDAGGFLNDRSCGVTALNEKLIKHFPARNPAPDALRVLLLDLSQYFSDKTGMLYDVYEPPMGLMYLMTYLHRQYGSRIKGKIAKSRMDFDSYEDLYAMLAEFKPQVIGIGALTFYRNFFHKTIALIRQMGCDVPIVAGGAYATSSYTEILQDRNIDLVVRGEGEVTFSELIGKMLENGGKLPGEQVLKEIPGMAFIPGSEKMRNRMALEIWMLDGPQRQDTVEQTAAAFHRGHTEDLAYTIYTSGSTGKPKGVLVKHRNVVRLVKNTNYVDFKAGDRILQTGAIDFDASSFEIWGALLNGLTLHFADKSDILEPTALAQITRKYDITTMWLTAPLFNHMAEADTPVWQGLKNLLVGGDALSPRHINKVRGQYPGLKIINGYGPTENTTFSTTFLIHKEEEEIPIGKPINNSTAYIMGKRGNIQPIGVVGELWVGGDGVSRGYLNDPELTAEKFGHDLWDHRDKRKEGPVKGIYTHEAHRFHMPHKTHISYIYKTGDLARWQEDGNIEFHGRMDQQVKIRGYRIDPAEIRDKLESHNDISNAIVIADKDANGERILAAYIVPRLTARTEALELSQLREFLSGELPDYMIPAYFKFIDKIPLTSNGKVDRRALPAIKDEKNLNYAAPRDETEKKLVELWAGILNKEEEIIGIDDNFFELGGHSLKAAQLAAAIHKRVDRKIALEEIFVSPTIRELARYLEKETAGDKFLSIKPVEKQEYYSQSPSQKRLYILQQMYPGLTSYNILAGVKLVGEIDSIRIENTLKKIIKRHESLRTSFDLIEGNSVQEIHQEIDFETRYWEASLPEQVEIICRELLKPFELSRPPLLRIGLIKIESRRHVLVMSMHHIITDGTSMQVFIDDFMSLYTGKKLPALRIQYKDYARWRNRWMQSKEGQDQEQYWLKEFQREIPVMTLPYDYPRPKFQDTTGQTMTFTIEAEETRALRKMAAEEETTMFILLLAQFNVFISRISGQEDITVGTVVAGRGHDDLREIMGIFANLLPLRNFPASPKSFKDFLKEVKERTLKALENQDYPFEEIVEKTGARKDMSRHPLFDVTFGFQDSPMPGLDIPGMQLEPWEYNDKTSKYDLYFIGAAREDRLVFTVEYCTGLFKQETVEKFIDHFKEIVVCILGNKDKKLADIHFSSDYFDREINNPQIQFGF